MGGDAAILVQSPNSTRGPLACELKPRLPTLPTAQHRPGLGGQKEGSPGEDALMAVSRKQAPRDLPTPDVNPGCCPAPATERINQREKR